jgi:hypothetical protein
MQKGFEMNLIVAMILALIGVSLFIAITNGGVRDAATSIYCKTFVKSSGGEGDISVPEICKGKSEFSANQIQSTDNKLFSRELLSYIISCWKKSDGPKVKEKYTCFELNLPGKVSNVTEADVSQILNKEDHCRSIENSDYGCGVMDQISWNVESGTITSQTILFIEYDPSKDVVVVSG